MAKQAEILAVFDTLARRASDTLEVEVALRELATAAAHVLSIDGAGVAYRRAATMRDGQLLGGRLEYVHAVPQEVAHAEKTQIDFRDGPCQDSIATNSVVVEENLAIHPERWPVFAERALMTGVHAVAALPLHARGEVWGALTLYRHEAGSFTDGELRVAQVLADVACNFVMMAHDRQTALLAHQLAVHAATHDPLTGLPNRALLDDRLAHAVATAQRAHTPLAVLFVDLDGFKSINDTFGHEAGDRLLTTVAARLQGLLRAGDTLARLGGDEFVIVCEGLRADPGGAAAPDAVSAVVERIYAALSEPIDLGGAQARISASIGVATSEGEAPAELQAQTLLRQADQAMYAVKHMRRGTASPP
ncbi:sensor domain-containing diguanylate cyclase [Kineococcus glutinatus]|uniref:GGDEF domain-containing protein n=1 Tax=Kineococcus glutinatus TaxID=1070872 RepID=A0ABP9HFA5_9ACTN